MKSNLKPILLLVAIATVLPELLTGSSSLSMFLDPARFIILFLGYGITVLVLREIAVRSNLSSIGVYILGIAYGIFNEGFLAKTLLRLSELPMTQYDHYGYFLGISFPFAFAITFWHAFASLLMPILLVYWVYPQSAREPWLSKRLTTILFIVLLGLGTLMFLGEMPVKGMPAQLAIFLGLMLVSFFIAKRHTGPVVVEETPAPHTAKPVWLGLSLFFTYFLILSLIADAKVHLAVFFAIFALIVYGYYRILKRKGWLTHRGLLLFGLGLYLQNTLLSTIFGFAVPERLFAGVVAMLFLIWLVRRVKRGGVVVI